MTNYRISTRYRRIVRCIAWTMIAATSLLGTTAAVAQTTLNFPSNYVAALPQVPNPDSTVTFGSSPSSLRFNTSGQLFASDGATIWQQVGGYSGSFTAIGAVPTSGSDPGPLNFTSDGHTILVGNGNGGPMASNSAVNGNFYTLPTTGSMSPASLVGNIPGTFDLIPVPAISTMSGAGTKFYVDSGSFNSVTFTSSSQVDVFDTSGADKPLITGIPGASTSLVFNPANGKLYVGVGTAPAAGQATIREFALAGSGGLDAAFAASSPLDWTAGTPLPGAVSNGTEGIGGGMFLDSRGDLFTGASDGLLVITPGGQNFLYNNIFYNNVTYNTVLYNGTYPIAFPSVTYNPVTDEFALETYDTSFDVLPPAARIQRRSVRSRARSRATLALGADWRRAAAGILPKPQAARQKPPRRSSSNLKSQISNRSPLASQSRPQSPRVGLAGPKATAAYAAGG